MIGHEDASGYSVYHFDMHGSTVALTNSSGAVTDRYTYGAYGEQLTHTGTSDTPFNFCGQYGVMTDANGLYYMRERYYAPEIKRFLNTDINKGDINDSRTLNLYTYASDSPIIFIDPEGLVIWWAAAAIVGAAVGLVSTFVGDVVDIALGNQEGLSSLGTYVGNTIGGAVGGVVTTVAGPVAGGAASGAVSNATQQGIDLLTGADEDGQFSVGELLIDTGVGAAFGYADIDIKVKGITAGRGSWSAVYERALTMRAKNMAWKTVGKGIGAGLVEDTPVDVFENITGLVLDSASASSSSSNGQTAMVYK